MPLIRARKVLLPGYKLVVFDEPDEFGKVPRPIVIDTTFAAAWTGPSLLKYHLQPLYYYVHEGEKNWDRRRKQVVTA